MAGFTVIENPLRTIWMPVDYNTVTCHVGQLVVAGATATTSGVKPWAVAGAGDTTADQVPFGVVVGTNNRTPKYASTYSAEYITSVQSQADQLARDWAMQEGMWSKGDPAAMVQVAVIGADTILKGRIFNAAWGTAPTEAVVTTGSTTGAGFTCATTGFEFTSVAYNATYYNRAGANMGLYRGGYDAGSGTSAKTVYLYWPYDIAIGDKIVGSNLSLGTCKMMFDAAGTYINNAAALTSDYIWADVLELNLQTAGDEYAIFRLNPLQLLGVRAA